MWLRLLKKLLVQVGSNDQQANVMQVGSNDQLANVMQVGSKLIFLLKIYFYKKI